eukprot:6058838-Pleurochrysis_carterae.AAC.1
MPPPEPTQRNGSTIAWILLATAAIAVAFAAGQTHLLEGTSMIKMPKTGIEIQKAYNMTTDCADEARRIMRAYPLTTYLVMAM